MYVINGPHLKVCISGVLNISFMYKVHCVYITVRPKGNAPTFFGLPVFSWEFSCNQIGMKFRPNFVGIFFATIPTISGQNLIRNASASTCKFAFGDSPVLFGNASSQKQLEQRFLHVRQLLSGQGPGGGTDILS